MNRYLLALISFYLGYLFLIYLGEENIGIFLKPFLIPSLLPIVLRIDSPSVKYLLIISLFFSFSGDVLLIFEGNIFFLLGLLSFLFAHLSYIVLSIKYVSPIKQVSLAILSGLLFIIYLLVLFQYLAPHLGDFFVPVIIYALVLAVFGFFGTLILMKYQSRASYLLFFGVLLFVISDSILAISNFVEAFDQDHFSIMTTYLCAQLFIVLCFKRLSEN